MKESVPPRSPNDPENKESAPRSVPNDKDQPTWDGEGYRHNTGNSHRAASAMKSLTAWLGNSWGSLKSPEVSNRLIAIATVVIALASGFSWWEAHGAGVQTNRIIAADERLAAAMESAVGQANVSLSATQNSFRDDQRAWLAPVSGTITLDKKHPMRIDVIVQNIGKTPALDVNSILDWRDIPAGGPLDLTYSPMVKHLGHGTLYPNSKQGVFASSLQIPTESELEAFRAGKRIFYFFGSVDYKDVFGRIHTSQFCNIINIDLSTVRSCDEHNEAN